MKMLKCAAVFCVICMIAAALGGCAAGNGFKETIIGGFNRALSSFSRFARTPDSQLQGSRVQGGDCYTGTYHADYTDFNGEEYLFGATQLESESGREICVTYQLQIKKGTAELCITDPNGSLLLTGQSETGTYIWKISPGDNYIFVQGNDLSGSLTILCE